MKRIDPDIVIYVVAVIMAALFMILVAGCAAPGQSAALRPSIKTGAGSTVTQTSSSLQRTDHALDAGRVALEEQAQREAARDKAATRLAMLGMILLMLVLDNPIKKPTWRFAVLMVAIGMLASPAVLLFGAFLR